MLKFRTKPATTKIEKIRHNFPERSCVPFDRRAVRADGEDRVKKGTDRDDVVTVGAVDDRFGFPGIWLKPLPIRWQRETNRCHVLWRPLPPCLACKAGSAPGVLHAGSVPTNEMFEKAGHSCGKFRERGDPAKSEYRFWKSVQALALLGHFFDSSLRCCDVS